MTTTTRQHTPGPWKAMTGTYEQGKYHKIIGPKGLTDSFHVLIGGQNMEADARLIAAAPALKELAEAIVREAGLNDYDIYDRMKRYQKQARAALAQAKGE